jgi:spore coat protein A
MWDDPVTETPRLGTVEIWNIVNASGDAHPVHIHLVQFQVLNRQKFDVNKYTATGQINLIGNPTPPDPNEQLAWKDTIKTYPDALTRVIARFELPAGTAPAPGSRYRYVWHCHILEHEDNEMMRPFDAVA